MTVRKELTVRTGSRAEMLDLTPEIDAALAASPAEDGFCLLFVPHTTAAVTVNEGADPDVRADILKAMARTVPAGAGYSHSEGNSDSHVKCSLFGVSLTLPFRSRRLELGRWQSVYFCEFDGPRTRKVMLHVIPC